MERNSPIDARQHNYPDFDDFGGMDGLSNARSTPIPRFFDEEPVSPASTIIRESSPQHPATPTVVACEVNQQATRNQFPESPDITLSPVTSSSVDTQSHEIPAQHCSPNSQSFEPDADVNITGRKHADPLEEDEMPDAKRSHLQTNSSTSYLTQVS